MNETTVKPIGGVRAAEMSVLARVMVSEKAENSAARERAGSEAERVTKAPETEKEQFKPVSNISIHFNVDEETNRLIVIVSERDSGRVIRTIPASELEKMQAGDLLKLNA
jgi:uncharacterized FlaG/YvyC family protein